MRGLGYSVRTAKIHALLIRHELQDVYRPFCIEVLGEQGYVVGGRSVGGYCCSKSMILK